MSTKQLICPHCDRIGGMERFEGLGYKKYGYEEMRCKYCGMVMPKDETMEKQPKKEKVIDITLVDTGLNDYIQKEKMRKKEHAEGKPKDAIPTGINEWIRKEQEKHEKKARA